MGFLLLFRRILRTLSTDIRPLNVDFDLAANNDNGGKAKNDEREVKKQVRLERYRELVEGALIYDGDQEIHDGRGALT